MTITYESGRRVQGLSGTIDTSKDSTGSGSFTKSVTGIVGNAWDFTGGKVTASFQFLPTSGDWTYSTWITFDNISGASNQVLRGTGAVFEIWRNSTGLNVAQSGNNLFEAHANLSNGTWYNIVLVHSSSGDTIYLNGVAKTTSTFNTVPTLTTWYLGGRANNTEQADGKMDQTALWDRALTSNEVSSLYSSPATLPSGLLLHYDFEQTGTTLENKAVIGDTKPTDVQLGSIFEETDTRKMYHRGIVTTPSLSKTDCVGYYTLDETSGNPTNHVTTANGFTDIPTQTIYYLAHGHDSTGRHFVKKVGSTVTTISESDWISLNGALTEAHTSGAVSALPSAWSGMWQGNTSSINGHGWYAISFSTDTNSPVNGSTGATQNITGKHGKCFEFSGGNNEQVGLNGAMMADYYYPTQHASTTHQADFAISCWINLSSDNTGYPSVISNYGGSNTGGFQFLLWGANTISFHTSTSAIHGSTVMSSGTWYHVVAMRESGYLKLYVNGSADGTAVANAHVIQAKLDMAIGGKADGTSGFNGKIDDVSIWRRALTTSEISSLHSTGTVLTTGTSVTSWIEEGT